MSNHLTIAYLTFRQNPRFEWLLSGLTRELEGVDPASHRLVIVDYHAEFRPAPLSPFHVLPKPSVWQGKHRLTKRDYFAASNARNTALCYAPDGWIAYLDDLSIIMPGWLKCIREAMTGGYIVQGAYKKVKDLRIEGGEVKYTHHPPGIDTRRGNNSAPVPSGPDWLYGCSAAMPVEALLKVNGWDEDCDSLGSEDYITGLHLAKAGYSFQYDKRMMTIESEEGHHEEAALPRFDKGISPHDKSHKILELVKKGKAVNPHFNLREVRASVLGGGSFPIPTQPDRDWFDGQLLSEL